MCGEKAALWLSLSVDTFSFLGIPYCAHSPRMRRWYNFDVISGAGDNLVVNIFSILIAAGLAIGLLMAWSERSKNKELCGEVTLAIGIIMSESGDDLRPNIETVMAIFLKRGFKLIEQTPDKLVFSYPSYMEKIMGQFILILIITFCGALGFAIAFVFTGTWPEKIEVNLSPSN